MSDDDIIRVSVRLSPEEIERRQASIPIVHDPRVVVPIRVGRDLLALPYEMIDDQPILIPVTVGLEAIDFVSTDPRLLLFADASFSRDSEASFEIEPGVISWFAPNVIRDDGRGRFLFEAERTNLVVSPENINATDYFLAAQTPIPNALVAPDGEMDATKIIINTTSDRSMEQFRPDLLDNTRYSGSAYVRQISAEIPEWIPRAQQNDGSVVSVAFAPLVQEWRRGSIEWESGAGGTNGSIEARTNGNSLNGAEWGVWGVQIEEGRFPSSFIRSGTRARDICYFDSAALLASGILDGRSRWVFYPSFSSDESIDLVNAFVFGIGSAGGIRLIPSPGVRIKIGASNYDIPCTWERGTRMQVEIDFVAGKARLTGAITGNTEIDISGDWTSDLTAQTYIGDRPALDYPFYGRIMEPTSIVVDDLLDFASLDFSRDCEATYQTAADEISVAPANQLRYEDRGDGHGPVPLFEGPGTNLFREFHDPSVRPPWEDDSVPLYLGSVVPSPSGGPSARVNLPPNADLWQEMSPALAENTQYAMSMWWREVSSGATQPQVQIRDKNGDIVYLNREEAPGADWERWVTVINSGTGAEAGIWQWRSVGADDTTRDFWGFQCEAGPFATSFMHVPRSHYDRLRVPSDDVPDQIKSGRWQIDVYPYAAVGESQNGVLMPIMYVDNPSSSVLAFFEQPGRIRFYIDGALVVNATGISVDRHAKMTFSVDMEEGRLDVETAYAVYSYSWTPRSWPTGDLYIGSAGGVANRYANARISPPRMW